MLLFILFVIFQRVLLAMKRKMHTESQLKVEAFLPQ